MTDALRRRAERQAQLELEAVYRKAEQLYAGWGCARSGECCQLAKTGREPYLWPVEWQRLERVLRAAGRLPMAPRPDGACPLLDAQGRCSAYADRPLGCRTFFCERGHGPRPVRREEVTALMTRLERVSQQLDPEVGEPERLIARLLDPSGSTRVEADHQVGDGVP
jgi:Fe-S-cluster containining protein